MVIVETIRDGTSRSARTILAHADGKRFYRAILSATNGDIRRLDDQTGLDRPVRLQLLTIAPAGFVNATPPPMLVEKAQRHRDQARARQTIELASAITSAGAPAALRASGATRDARQTRLGPREARDERTLSGLGAQAALSFLASAAGA